MENKANTDNISDIENKTEIPDEILKEASGGGLHGLLYTDVCPECSEKTFKWSEIGSTRSGYGVCTSCGYTGYIKK